MGIVAHLAQRGHGTSTYVTKNLTHIPKFKNILAMPDDVKHLTPVNQDTHKDEDFPDPSKCLMQLSSE